MFRIPAGIYATARRGKMHLPNTVIEYSVTVGIAPDGSPLRRWTEENGTRLFEERYIYFTSMSGQRYGLVNVVEIDQ